MGIGNINIWVSDIANPCGTLSGGGSITVLDCKGILKWPCGRFLSPDGKWINVPNGEYKNIPFRCGHLQVEVPPGCYWIISGDFTEYTERKSSIHFNNTTHVGIVQVGCDQTACVKLYNPTIRLCWDWFLIGLTSQTEILKIDPEKLKRAVALMKELIPKELGRERLPIEGVIEELFEGFKKGPSEKK